MKWGHWGRGWPLDLCPSSQSGHSFLVLIWLKFAEHSCRTWLAWAEIGLLNPMAVVEAQSNLPPPPAPHAHTLLYCALPQLWVPGHSWHAAQGSQNEVHDGGGSQAVFSFTRPGKTVGAGINAVGSRVLCTRASLAYC